MTRMEDLPVEAVASGISIAENVVTTIRLINLIHGVKNFVEQMWEKVWVCRGTGAIACGF